ncbi:hypothetical protein SAMN05443144_1359 [Fodinibius roseus]|uniref:Uncharacterized protein n=1 Tax=Fodinibius roseus TaxID=1194090 RepID=A0A1M5KXY6_9BACT|nr:hypothetical protein [Fodinibius roseus]SHG57033.1 hypothetical protein SAMN05443144_1359 [Fodinibius roseus]
MNILLKIVSFFGLGLTVVPSILVFWQSLSMEDHKFYMIFGMILWFATSPFWMKEQEL